MTRPIRLNDAESSWNTGAESTSGSLEERVLELERIVRHFLKSQSHLFGDMEVSPLSPPQARTQAAAARSEGTPSPMPPGVRRTA